MNKTRIHDEIEDWMAGSLCKALSLEEQTCLEDHLAQCASCRILFQEEQKINSMLNTTFQKFQPDPYFEQRILNRFRNQTTRSGFSLIHWLSLLTQSRPVQAVCAVLLLAVMVKSGTVLTRENNGGPSIFTDDNALNNKSNGLHDAKRSVADKTAANIPEMKNASSALVEDAPASKSEAMPLAPIVAFDFPQAGRKATDLPARGRASDAIEKPTRMDQTVHKGSVETDATPEAAGLRLQQAQFGGKPEGSTNATICVDTRKLIRNASLTIEVAHFEKAIETITAIASEETGYVATQNSGRRVNGKSEGTIVIKVPSTHLDSFLQKLLPLGELKNQNIGVEDVTSAYFDTDARLRNSKRMEARLLEMLDKNTGKVSDLLQVEKELSRVREQIEQMQGQLKLYDSLTAYATVSILLSEKDLNQPAAFLLREHVNLSLFSKDVEKTFAEAKTEANAAKAQVIESRVDRNEGGQVSATLRLLFTPENADAAILHLKTLGRIQSFDSKTDRVARNGSGNSDSAAIERDKVELNLLIQRDVEGAVQQTSLEIKTDRVEEKSAEIKQTAVTDGIEIKSASFIRRLDGVEVSDLSFRMPMQKYQPFLSRIKGLGTVKNFTVNRNEDKASENSPAQISLQIFSQGNIVSEENSLFSTVRKTLTQGFNMFMWSLRMISVSVAFIAPWALSLGVIGWLIARYRNR